jgi:hypothetical protein
MWFTRSVVLVLAVLSFTLVSCRRPMKAPLHQPFDLHVGQGARFSKTDLELYFRRVAADSRCPRDAQCITAGEARVTFDGRINQGMPETFDAVLPAAAGEPDSTTFRAYDGYRIRLLKLEPYPVAGGAVDTTAYVATLVVEKR